MKISARAKSKLAGLIESSTRTTLKFGVPVLVLCAGFLLYMVLGPKLRMLGQMSIADRAYLHSSVAYGILMFRVASLVVVLALALRFFAEGLVGQILSIAGAVLYFLSAVLFASATGGALAQVQTYQEIVAEFIRLGLVALIPGVVLVVRDIIARITYRIRARKYAELLQLGPARFKAYNRKLYEKCWDMPICPDYVQKYCPAYEKKKPCWQIKSGCLCVGEGAYKAMLAESSDDGFARKVLKGIQTEKQYTSDLTPAQKRNRCRKCVIYSEHQRQKYRIASTLTFPAVALLFWILYQPLSTIAWDVLEKTDKFLCFLAYNVGHAPSFASQGHALTVLALICLGIMALSYALRAVEYFIFKLQV